MISPGEWVAMREGDGPVWAVMTPIAGAVCYGLTEGDARAVSAVPEMFEVCSRVFEALGPDKAPLSEMERAFFRGFLASAMAKAGRPP